MGPPLLIFGYYPSILSILEKSSVYSFQNFEQMAKDKSPNFYLHNTKSLLQPLKMFSTYEPTIPHCWRMLGQISEAKETTNKNVVHHLLLHIITHEAGSWLDDLAALKDLGRILFTMQFKLQNNASTLGGTSISPSYIILDLAHP